MYYIIDMYVCIYLYKWNIRYSKILKWNIYFNNVYLWQRNIYYNKSFNEILIKIKFLKKNLFNNIYVQAQYL